MPRYDYRCPECEEVFEVTHGMTEEPDFYCPGDECGEIVIMGDGAKLVEKPKLKRMMPTSFNFSISDGVPDSALIPNTGQSSIGPDDEKAHRVSAKMNEDTKMKVMRQRYARRNALLEAMCDSPKFEEKRKSGEIQPKVLKAMFSKGLAQKTPRRSQLDKPRPEN